MFSLKNRIDFVWCDMPILDKTNQRIILYVQRAYHSRKVTKTSLEQFRTFHTEIRYWKFCKDPEINKLKSSEGVQ